jgi:hypothetical protein
MDFQILGEETLKLKCKKVNLAVDPREKIAKMDAEAILLTDKLSDVSRVNEYRVVIDGPGEYELSGLKVSGLKSEEGMIYTLVSDNADVLIARSSAINKISTDKLGDYKIVVINVDVEINQTVITAMEPSVVVLYGELKKEGAKKLGSEVATVTSKISIVEDKLPEELEVMLLG